MTTIATDGKTIAADGLAIDHQDTIIATENCKLSVLADGSIVGCAGVAFDSRSYLDWLIDGKPGECPIQSEAFNALILHTDGKVSWVDHQGRELIVPAPVAIGSGATHAIGALDAGADPFTAVEIAAKRDPFTGGKIIAIKR